MSFFPSHPSLSSSSSLITDSQPLAYGHNHATQEYAYILFRASHPTSKTITHGSNIVFHVFHSVEAARMKLFELHERLCELSFNTLEMENKETKREFTSESETGQGFSHQEGFQWGFFAGRHLGAGKAAVYTEDIWVEGAKLGGCAEEQGACLHERGDPTDDDDMDIEMMDVDQVGFYQQDLQQTSNAFDSSSMAYRLPKDADAPPPIPTKAYILLRAPSPSPPSLKPYSTTKPQHIPSRTAVLVHHDRAQVVAASRTAPRTWIAELDFEDICPTGWEATDFQIYEDQDDSGNVERRQKMYDDGVLGSAEESNFAIANDGEPRRDPLMWINAGQQGLLR